MDSSSHVSVQAGGVTIWGMLWHSLLSTVNDHFHPFMTAYPSYASRRITHHVANLNNLKPVT